MDVLLISFITSLSYLIILSKVFSLSFVIRTQILWDVLFTFGVPMLFIGTYSGMVTGVLSGIMFTLMLSFVSLLSGQNRKVVL
jgi:hypothetical protein